MTLENYLEHLQKIVQENPEALQMEVIYAKDSEGNGFESIHFEPSLGNFDPEDSWGGFTSQAQIEEEPEEYDENIKINAICVN